MEKSNVSDKNEGEENNIDEYPENDEVQQEREVLKQINKDCSNKNELMAFNSADDVRQAQKHDNAGEGLVIHDEEESNVLSRNDGDRNNERSAKAVPKNKKREKNDNDSRRQKSRSDRNSKIIIKFRNEVKKVPKKRPGGSSKAGPRRKLKKSTAQQMLVSISCSSHSSSSSLLSRSSGY